MTTHIHTTVTHWTVTVDFEQQTGTAQWKDDESTRATFTVGDFGTVYVRTVDQVPHHLVSDVQHWVSGLIGLA